MLLNRVWPSKRQILNGLILALIVSLVITGAAIAGSMHFSSGGGTWSSPLVFWGSVVGVGHNDYVLVTATGEGMAPLACTNNGHNVAPGQATVYVTGSASGTWTPDGNGRASGQTEGIVPTLDREYTWEEAGCPNPKWYVDGVIEDEVAWYSMHVVATTNLNETDTMDLTCYPSIGKHGKTYGYCEPISG